MTLEAIIFDVDGTLAETEEAHRAAFNAAFAEFGLGWHWDQDLYGRLLTTAGGRARIERYWREVDPAAAAAASARPLAVRLHERKTAIFQELVRTGGLPLRPGVARLLREAREAGLRLAIATTTSEGNVETLITATLGAAALRWFAAIGAGDVVRDRKPAPDIYHHVLRQLNLPAGACLAIEDSENGLRSARAAGLGTVITVNPYTRREDFEGALAVLSDLGEPTRPCRTLGGTAPAGDCVDVAMLREWAALNAGRR